MIFIANTVYNSEVRDSCHHILSSTSLQGRGLAEGFSSVPGIGDEHAYHIALSIEKERAAHSTLRLRSFLRQFNGALPDQYYDFGAGR